MDRSRHLTVVGHPQPGGAPRGVAAPTASECTARAGALRLVVGTGDLGSDRAAPRSDRATGYFALVTVMSAACHSPGGADDRHPHAPGQQWACRHRATGSAL